MTASQTARHLAATVGENIRSARRAAGLTQRELAQRLDVADLQVSRWERGAHRPKDDTLIALAEILSREFSWFFIEHEDQEPAAA